VIYVGEGNLGGVNRNVAFVRLKNLTSIAQTAFLQFDVDGRAAPLTYNRTVPACGSIVVGVHELAAFPANANFGVTVRWPQDGSATLIVRSLDDFWNQQKTLVPPVDRVR
jgi:hypothetical protein